MYLSVYLFQRQDAPSVCQGPHQKGPLQGGWPFLLGWQGHRRGPLRGAAQDSRHCKCSRLPSEWQWPECGRDLHHQSNLCDQVNRTWWHFQAFKCLFSFNESFLFIRSMGLYKKDLHVAPLLMHWSYVFLALTHRDVYVTSYAFEPCGGIWCQTGLGSNTYLYLQIQIQIQIRRICICICIWSNFKPCICICICIWSTVFGVFNKYVFKYTFFPGPFSKHKFMEHKLTWILFINMLKNAILFKNKCRVLILLIPICARWLCVHLIWLVNEHVTNHQLNYTDMDHFAMPLEQVNV